MIPTHVRRRRDDLLEHRAERLAVRARLHAAAQLAREPQLEHARPRQPVPADERRDVFAELESAESDRPELRPRSRGSRCRAKDRPVFVNPTSIFPTTGAILSRDARVTQSFAQVTDYLSDLQSHSTQLSARCLAGRVQLGVPVERDVRLAEGRRQDARLRRRDDRRRSVPHPVGARRSRCAPPDHVQRRLHVPSGGERHRVRTRPVGQPVHADRSRATSTATATTTIARSSTIRPRRTDPTLASGDAESARERSELGARLPQEATRHDRRQEQLRRSVVARARASASRSSRRR